MIINDNKAGILRYFLFAIILFVFVYKLSKVINGNILAPRAYSKACSLKQNKDYLGAIALFERVAKEYARYPRGSEALLKAGDCYLHLGDETKAREYFQEIIRRHTDLCTPEMAQKCLSHLESGHKAEYSGLLSNDGKCPLEN